MASHSAAAQSFREVVEHAGYYQNGRPVPGLLEAASLKANVSIDKQVKYRPIFDAKRLGATAVFELSGSPCIYFKTLDAPEPPAWQLADIHRMAWNHGLAPLLWVITPTKVLVFDCHSRPRHDDVGDPARHILQQFERTERGLRELDELMGFFEIQSGRTWTREPLQRRRRERVDEALLADLETTEQQLIEKGLPAQEAHALLGRSIFVAYLEDRGLLTRELLMRATGCPTFRDALGRKTTAYQVFQWIRDTFNGDLFPLIAKTGRPLTRELDLVRQPHLEILQDLRSGMEMSTRQGRLWAYNFSIIPVELISSIYEMFAHAFDSKKARDMGMHYTPVNLVDLVLSHVFTRVPKDGKILDPACGSGLFLVESLRRLVSLRAANGADLTGQLVRETLYRQIYGIDISFDAVQIAAFSLYLASLELDPEPQPLNQLKFKPLIGSSLFVSDFFDENAAFNFAEPFRSKGFAAIVANPPWTRGKEGGSAVEYTQRRQHSVSGPNPDQAFLWRARDFAGALTEVGFVMSSRPFFRHHARARHALGEILRTFGPRLLVNLSRLRHDLFATSTGPAMVFIASVSPSTGDALLTFASADASAGFKQHGIIEISPDMVKRLPLERILQDDDLLKVASWGTVRDFSLIRRLRIAHPSLGRLIGTHGWAASQGFIRGASDRGKLAPSLYGLKWLPGGAMRRYWIDVARLQLLPRWKLERPRSRENYQGPLLVVLLVVRRGIAEPRVSAAFCPSDLVYTENYFGIPVPRRETVWAHYLNAVLNSRLATYFLFFTSSSWGVERDEVKPNDLRRLPIAPLPKDDYLRRLLDLERTLRSSYGSDEVARNAMDDLVFDLYDLEDAERILVRDGVDVTLGLGVRQSQSSAGPAASLADVKQYARQLVLAFRGLLTPSRTALPVAEVYRMTGGPLCAIRLTRQSSPVASADVEVRVIDSAPISGIFTSLSRMLQAEFGQELFSRRILRIYADTDLYIVKPAERRYWTLAAALNDADAILSEHLTTRDGR